MKKNHFSILLGLFVCFLFCPLAVSAASVDLGFKPLEIRLAPTEENLVAGSEVTVSVKVYNFGSQAATGEVVLFQGVKIIGTRSVSLAAGEKYQTLSFPLVVPTGDFNLLVKLANVSPADKVASNDSALSRMYFVSTSKTENGFESVANSVDSDDVGVEETAGSFETDPFKTEKLNSQVSAALIVPPVVAVTSSKAEKIAVPPAPIIRFEPEKETTREALPSSEDDLVLATTALTVELVEDYFSSPPVSPADSIFLTARRLNWNTYEFSFASEHPDFNRNSWQAVWHFSDGKNMTGVSARRVFWSWGEQIVTLIASDGQGGEFSGKLSVRLDFWVLDNYWLWLGVIILSLLALKFLNRRAAVVLRERKNRSPLRRPKKRIYFDEVN